MGLPWIWIILRKFKLMLGYDFRTLIKDNKPDRANETSVVGSSMR